MRITVQSPKMMSSTLLSLALWMMTAMMMMMNDDDATGLVHAIPDTATTTTTTTTHPNQTVASTSNIHTSSSGGGNCSTSSFSIPTQLSSPFLSYPNVLGITETERRTIFHPVLFFPRQCWKRALPTANRSDQVDGTRIQSVFVCPATDFTSDTTTLDSSLTHPQEAPPTPATKKKKKQQPQQQLLSTEEFQVAQSQRQQRHTLFHHHHHHNNRPRRRLLQKLRHDIRQSLLQHVRYPFRYIIPSIQFFFDHHHHPFHHQMCLPSLRWLHRRWFWRTMDHDDDDDDRNQNVVPENDETTGTHCTSTATTKTYVGKYDEDRIGLYTSDLFRSNNDSTHTATASTSSNGQNDNNNNCTFRSVHVGIDLSIGGRVGTPVYAFIDGRIHSVGYNSDLGDYGNVLVVEHFWDRRHSTTTTNHEKVVVYALYGHLSDESILFKRENDTIRKGQVIGYIGNVYENGGWYIPHLHFQLSTAPPEQPHDMPGAICLDDRNRWLSQYLDPRYVLGALH